MPCGCMPPPPPQKGPSEYIPSRTYPDPFVNLEPGYVPMHGPGHFGPGFPCCHPHPVPQPDTHTPDPECECPPKIYRNPPDATVIPGDHVTVEVDDTDVMTTYYKVNAVQFPVVLDPECSGSMYGDGTPGAPLGIDDFLGAKFDTDGEPGVVPAPKAGDEGKFLCGNGKWKEVINSRECRASEMDRWLSEVE